MYRPLIDVDTNTRQLGCVVPKPSPKPSDSMAPASTGSDHRRNPFRVSTSGSPRYVTHTSASKPGLTPPIGSKIPRKTKVGTPTLAPKRTTWGIGSSPQSIVRPKTRGENQSHAKRASAIPTAKLSPAAFRDKPLPSPPIAQIVNQSSPPKAQRTLVDAEVTGTPSSEEWPILSPEQLPSLNVTPPDKQESLTAEFKGMQQLLEDYSSPFEDHPAKSGPQHHSEPESSPQYASPDSSRLVNMPRPKEASSEHSEAIVHAITTTLDVALESPVASKLAVPPRVSSKYTSLPLPNSRRDSPAFNAALAAASRRRRGVTGSTKWPLLEPNDSDELLPEMTPEPSARLRKSAVVTNNEPGKDRNQQANSVPKFSDTDQSALTRRASIGTSISRSMGAETCLEDISSLERETTTRVKRPYRHSTGSGLGPTLRIADDAHAVLFGQETNPTPNASTDKPSEERSWSALANRMSRQTLSRLSLNRESRSNTPYLNEDERNAGEMRRTHPSESVQSADTASGDAEPKMSPSPTSPPSTEPSKISKLPFPSTEGKRSSSAASRDTSSYKSKFAEAKRSVSAQSSRVTSKANKKNPDMKTWPLEPSLPTIDQTLGISVESVITTPQMTSSVSKGFALDNLIRKKNAAGERSMTGALPVRSLKQHAQDLEPDMHSSNSGSSTFRVLRSRNKGPSPRSQSRMIKDISPAHHKSAPERNCPSTSNQKKTVRQSKSSAELPDKGSNERSKNSRYEDDSNAAKVKAKRSLRDFFHKREGKRAEKAPQLAETKQASSTKPGSSLAKRFRSSANFSRVALPKTADSEVEPPPESKISQPKPGPTEECEEPSPPKIREKGTSDTSSDTAVIVNKIVNRVSSLPNDSPDRLHGLEIAEAILNSVESYKQAKISAMKAKKHARDAELNAKRAGVELERLQRLCVSDFDNETVQTLSYLVNTVNLGKHGEQSSPSSGTATPGQ